MAVRLIFEFFQEKIKGQNLEFNFQNLEFFCLLGFLRKTKKEKFTFDIQMEREGEEDTNSFSENNSVDNDNESDSSQNTILQKFKSFCSSKNAPLEKLLASESFSKKKQNQLLRNFLLVCETYLKLCHLSKEELENMSEITENEDLELREMLENLESYEDLIDLEIKNLVIYYILRIERRKLEANGETINTFFKLQGQENPGLFSTQSHYEKAIEEYNQYFNDPSIQKQRDYIFHKEDREEWDEETGKRFLEGLLKFFDVTINNKKISTFIGGSVLPNHVKFVKGNYMRKLKKRAEEARITPRDLLSKDIEDFHPELLSFKKKVKTETQRANEQFP